MTGHRIDLRSHLSSGYINGELLAVRVPGWVDHPGCIRQQHWLASRIDAVNTVIIAECYGAACETAARPVPAPIRAGRCKVYKRLHIARREIEAVQLDIVGSRCGISFEKGCRRFGIQDGAVIVDL